MTGTLGLNIPSVSDCRAQASYGGAGVTSQHPLLSLRRGRVGARRKPRARARGLLCLREAGLVRFQNKWALYGFSERMTKKKFFLRPVESVGTNKLKMITRITSTKKKSEMMAW